MKLKLSDQPFEFEGLAFTEDTVEPNSGLQAPLHRHNSDNEAWYVVEGELVFLVNDEKIFARQGEVIQVSAGIAHTYWNESEKPTRTIIFMTPNLKKLIDAFDQAEETGEPLDELYRRFDSELV